MRSVLAFTLGKFTKKNLKNHPNSIETPKSPNHHLHPLYKLTWNLKSPNWKGTSSEPSSLPGWYAQVPLWRDILWLRFPCGNPFLIPFDLQVMGKTQEASPTNQWTVKPFFLGVKPPWTTNISDIFFENWWLDSDDSFPFRMVHFFLNWGILPQFGARDFSAASPGL